MKVAHIFIDEFGNSALDLSKSGTFSHFVYTSVILPQDMLRKAEVVRQELCRKFKLGPDIKSSNIKESQFDKRLQILKYLMLNLDVTVDVLVVDKARIESEGLVRKRVFYKYFQTLYVSKYNKRYRSFYITADKVGDTFKKELQEYVNKNGIQKDLFNPDRFFLLGDDKEQKLLQFADLIAGCLGKVFCTSHSHERAREIHEIIKTRMSVDYFPYPQPKGSVHRSHFDNEIRVMNYDLVKGYYEKADVGSNSTINRLLQYLALQAEINDQRFVSTNELLTYLQLFNPGYTVDKLRIIIRDLRYEGLFIVSHSGKHGYKLATCYEDISEHFKHFMKHVLPMLQKLDILNQRISQGSFNRINPLEKDEALNQIKELIAALK